MPGIVGRLSILLVGYNYAQLNFQDTNAYLVRCLKITHCGDISTSHLSYLPAHEAHQHLFLPLIVVT